MLGLEGTTLGTNTLLRRIGGGGMGDVYLAEQAPLGRRVAVKVIRVEGGPVMTDEARERAARHFAREARTIAALDHPHILPLYDHGEQDGFHYLVTLYIEDGSLADLLAPGAPNRLTLPLAPALVAQIIAQAASALQYAHDQGIIHRDIKPHNILIKRQDPGTGTPDTSPTAQVHVYLTDFGVARFLNEVSTRTGVAGTPQYSAPEQFKGAPVPATDQYALACVAYLLLTGRSPFEGAIVELYHQHLNVPPDPPSQHLATLPREVDGVLLRALAKEPEARFPAISAFASALSGALVPGTAAPAVVEWPRPASARPLNSAAGTPMPPAQAPSAPATPAAPFADIAATPPLPASPPPGAPLLPPDDPLGVAHTPAPTGATTEPDGRPALKGAVPHWPGATAPADGKATLLPKQVAMQRGRTALVALAAALRWQTSIERRRTMLMACAVVLLLVAVAGALFVGPGVRGGGSTGNGLAGTGNGGGAVYRSDSSATSTTSKSGSGGGISPTETHPAGGPHATATSGNTGGTTGGSTPVPSATATNTALPADTATPTAPPPPPPSPTPTQVPPPPETIQIGWSSVHPTWIWMSLDGFPTGYYNYTCNFGSGGDQTFTLHETTEPETFDNGHTCYDTIRGDTVWVTLNSVTSNQITVP